MEAQNKIINNEPINNFCTLNSLMEVIPMKLIKKTIEEENYNSLSGSKKKKVNNQHYSITAKNKKKKNLKILLLLIEKLKRNQKHQEEINI